MSLNEWRENGWLRVHRSSVSEIADLLALADRDLKDSRTPGLSDDWKFNIATTRLCRHRPPPLPPADKQLPSGRVRNLKSPMSLRNTFEEDFFPSLVISHVEHLPSVCARSVYNV